ncbi:Hypothetical_protein [Hexamita inflata]|uniref:Hypothetical_protein n=1 Tax=Hexamita inflata TaxID=28002 RepID=A0ABP1JGX6_9EUKA
MNNSMCQCQTIGAFVQVGACICGQYALNTSNTCTCPTNSTLINNICTCDKIIGQSMISGSCQCPSGQSIVNNSCQQTSYVINISNFECSQEIYTSNYNIKDVTNQINASSNFSSGYVFSSSIVIKNAFIDVSDNVYTATVYSLFQSQNTFTNIKIQFGSQSLNTGSLITQQSTITINQMNIISRPQSQLTASAQLNILTSASTNVNISNLLVNLSFAPSRGSITLISNINGALNISGYQILGSFVSTGTVAIIGININATIINIDKANFQPIMFNVGNDSSYLFGNAITTACVFTINNIAFVLGNNQNFLNLDSVSSDSSNYYLFGGIIAYINSASLLSVNNVIINSYLILTTNYISNFGFLIGYVQQNSSNIAINNVCIQHNMTSKTLDIRQFGFIGYNFGNISIQNAAIIFFAQIPYLNSLWGFGIIGLQQSALYAEVINLSATVSYSLSQGNHVGSIFGLSYTQNCSVQNSTMNGGNISSGSIFVGGFFGCQYTQNMTIYSSTISKMNISGSNSVGGFVGWCASTFYLINSKIQFIRIFSSSSAIGVIIGQTQGVYIFSGSSSTSNSINSVLQNDCTVLSNNWSVAGC